MPRNQYLYTMVNILRLKEILKEKGVTGKELADMIGVTPASISNIIQGNSFPKPETLLNIANALNVDIRDLFEPTKSTFKRPLFIKDDNGVFLEVGTLNFQKSQSTPPKSIQE